MVGLYVSKTDDETDHEDCGVALHNVALFDVM